MTPIEKVINIAKKEIGYLEKKNTSNLYDKTKNAGSNNYTKYWAEIKPSFQGQPWCACFVTWVFTQAFGVSKTRELLKHYPFVYCPTLGNLFKLNSNPKVGDIVLFYKNSRFSHTGIVTSVQGDYFTTVEGNTSGGSNIVANGGGVCAKGYYNSKLPGTKFVTVNWDLVTTEVVFTETPLNNLQGIITTSTLNVRKKPSTDATIIGTHAINDVVLLSAKTSNGWYKVIYPSLGVGYISAQYVREIPIEEDLTQEEFNVLFTNYLADLANKLPDDWSADARYYSEASNFINGDEFCNKKYKAYLTREELAVILFNIFGKR